MPPASSRYGADLDEDVLALSRLLCKENPGLAQIQDGEEDWRKFEEVFVNQQSLKSFGLDVLVEVAFILTRTNKLRPADGPVPSAPRVNIVVNPASAANVDNALTRAGFPTQSIPHAGYGSQDTGNKPVAEFPSTEHFTQNAWHGANSGQAAGCSAQVLHQSGCLGDLLSNTQTTSFSFTAQAALQPIHTYDHETHSQNTTTDYTPIIRTRLNPSARLFCPNVTRQGVAQHRSNDGTHYDADSHASPAENQAEIMIHQNQVLHDGNPNQPSDLSNQGPEWSPCASPCRQYDWQPVFVPRYAQRQKYQELYGSNNMEANLIDAPTPATRRYERIQSKPTETQRRSFETATNHVGGSDAKGSFASKPAHETRKSRERNGNRTLTSFGITRTSRRGAMKPAIIPSQAAQDKPSSGTPTPDTATATYSQFFSRSNGIAVAMKKESEGRKPAPAVETRHSPKRRLGTHQMFLKTAGMLTELAPATPRELPPRSSQIHGGKMVRKPAASQAKVQDSQNTPRAVALNFSAKQKPQHCGKDVLETAQIDILSESPAGDATRDDNVARLSFKTFYPAPTASRDKLPAQSTRSEENLIVANSAVNTHHEGDKVNKMAAKSSDPIRLFPLVRSQPYCNSRKRTPKRASSDAQEDSTSEIARHLRQLEITVEDDSQAAGESPIQADTITPLTKHGQKKHKRAVKNKLKATRDDGKAAQRGIVMDMTASQCSPDSETLTTEQTSATTVAKTVASDEKSMEAEGIERVMEEESKRAGPMVTSIDQATEDLTELSNTEHDEGEPEQQEHALESSRKDLQVSPHRTEEAGDDIDQGHIVSNLAAPAVSQALNTKFLNGQPTPPESVDGDVDEVSSEAAKLSDMHRVEAPGERENKLNSEKKKKKIKKIKKKHKKKVDSLSEAVSKDFSDRRHGMQALLCTTQEDRDELLDALMVSDTKSDRKKRIEDAKRYVRDDDEGNAENAPQCHTNPFATTQQRWQELMQKTRVYHQQANPGASEPDFSSFVMSRFDIRTGLKMEMASQ